MSEKIDDWCCEKEFSTHGASRRNFLKASALAAASPLLNVPFAAALPFAEAAGVDKKSPPRPNILMVISDQFRSDFICAAGQNPMALTPNLDAMYRRGTVFQNAMTNQPLCSPSRACLFTGQYDNRADPAQLFNLCGRVDPPGIVHYVGDRSMRQITAHLRYRLIQRMVEAGERRPKIDLWEYYP